MDAGVAALGVVFGFLFIVRHTATTHSRARALPKPKLARASIKFFRSLLILAGALMIVVFTKPLPPLSRALVSLVVAVAAISAGWYLVPWLTRPLRRRRARRSVRIHPQIPG
jgi:Na+/H+ antiporter NhaD/arsenite permease-like protein